jgi:hypothetical protein
MEPYKTFNETLAVGLLLSTSETVTAPCGPVLVCHKSYCNLNVAAGAGSGLKCSEKTGGGGGLVKMYIQFGCWSPENFPDNEAENASSFPKITSNVYCQSTPDLSSPLFRWECNAFSKGTNFSRFLQEVEAFNSTCVGIEPVFRYHYTVEETGVNLPQHLQTVLRRGANLKVSRSSMKCMPMSCTPLTSMSPQIKEKVPLPAVPWLQVSALLSNK